MGAPALFFPTGEHFYLGANLARLELRVILDEVMRRIPDLELAGPVEGLRSNFVAGIKRMPVRFTPKRATAGELLERDPGLARRTWLLIETAFT